MKKWVSPGDQLATLFYEVAQLQEADAPDAAAVKAKKAEIAAMQKKGVTAGAANASGVPSCIRAVQRAHALSHRPCTF